MRPVADSALETLSDFLFAQGGKILAVAPGVFCGLILEVPVMLPKGGEPEFSLSISGSDSDMSYLLVLPSFR